MIEASRRSFITGLAALVTAPAIVRAGSLMPVKSMVIGIKDIGIKDIDALTLEAMKTIKVDVLYGRLYLFHQCAFMSDEPDGRGTPIDEFTFGNSAVTAGAGPGIT